MENEEVKWKTNEFPSKKKAALARLAYEVMMSDDIDVRRTRRSWVRGWLREIYEEGVVDEILAEGLIVLSPDQQRYEFTHPSLRDFFCAWHLANHHSKQSWGGNIILDMVGHSEKVLDPKWEKSIVFYAGLVSDTTVMSLIERMTDEKKTKDDILLSGH